MFNNKSILVTGGTGSFGKKFIKRKLQVEIEHLSNQEVLSIA